MPRRNPVLALALAGLLVRLAFLAIEPSTGLAGDEHTWTTWGAGVLAGQDVNFSPLRLRLIFYPPLYPYFIAAAFRVLGTLKAVKLCQIGLSVLLVPALFRLGGTLFGRPAGLVAAGIAAFYPDLVWFSAHFWSETLFLVLLWWAFERVAVAEVEGRLSAALFGGLVWGLATLTRETPLFFTPVIGVFLAFRPRRPGGGTRGASFLLAALLVVAPWTLRNFIVYKAFVPVSTAGALNLWQGNALLTRQEVYDKYAEVHGRIEKYHYAQKMGLAAIRDRQPLWLFEKLLAEMPQFWEADSLALIHIRRGAYGGVGAPFGAVAAAVTLLPYLAVVALFTLGVASAPLDRGKALLLGFAFYYTALHVATHGFARYRLPIMPVLFLYAAWAFASWRSGSLPRLSLRQKSVAAILGAVLAASIVPSLTAAWAEPSFTASEDSGAPPE